MNADTLVAVLSVIVGIMALIVPGVAVVAFRLGRIGSKAESAHHRLDSLEERLATEFKDLGERLEKAMTTAWHHCPVAQTMTSPEELAKSHRKRED